MSRRPINPSRRLADSANIPFASSLHPKSRSSPFLSIGLVLLGAFLLIGYTYSGPGVFGGDKEDFKADAKQGEQLLLQGVKSNCNLLLCGAADKTGQQSLQCKVANRGSVAAAESRFSPNRGSNYCCKECKVTAIYCCVGQPKQGCNHCSEKLQIGSSCCCKKVAAGAAVVPVGNAKQGYQAVVRGRQQGCR